MVVCTEEAIHTQVPFVTRRGVQTEVDEGMWGLLTQLKDLGLETEWSCEGGDGFPAYVTIKGWGCDRFIHRAISRHRSGKLSSQAHKVMYGFTGGLQERQAVWYVGEGNEDSPMYPTAQLLRLRMPQLLGHGYTFERELSNRYGYRIVLRWPPKATPDVELLLLELVSR